MAGGVNVAPGITLPTHDLSLSDGETTIGFRLDKGIQSMIERSATPSTLLNRGGATKFGDYDPSMAQVEQRTYIGGRGSRDVSADNTRFWDSKNLFSMIDGRVFPAPQWKTPSGLRTTHENLPGDVAWQPVYGSEQYIAASFTVGASDLGADNVGVWIRRIGVPSGVLFVEIWTDSGGSPSTLVTSASDYISKADVVDYVSEFWNFDLSAAADLTAATTYWVVVYSNDTGDDENHHWEVAVDDTGISSKISTAGSSWSAASFDLYYRVMDAHTDRDFRFFTIYGALMAVDRKADNTASSIYLNGEIGVITTATSATSITDSNMGEDGSWTADQWAGWKIRITKTSSSDAEGMIGTITANTNAGVMTISGFTYTPSAGDVYVIYGGTDWQVPSSGTPALGTVLAVTTMNNIAYFAQGSGDNIRRMRYDSSTHAFGYADDGSARADLLWAFDDPVDGPVIWMADVPNTYVKRAKAVAWGTNLTFGTQITVGSDNTLITKLIDYDRKLWVFKEDAIYVINNDRAERLNIGLDFIKSKNNGQAAEVHKLFLVFSWGDFSIMRYYGADLSAIGPEKNYGLPNNRKGKCVALKSHPAGLFAVINSGSSGYSSVLVREEGAQGWHEIFRAPVAGWEIDNIYWQDNQGTSPYLWISVNGELFYQTWPNQTFNPLEDSGFDYQHEAVIEIADIDMGAARLPKALSDFSMISENLTDGVEIYLDYQIDDDIGSTTWIPAGRFSKSPVDKLPIDESEIYRVRPRLRLVTDTASTPPLIVATVLTGILRTPFRRQWTFRIRTSDFQVTRIGVGDASPGEVISFLYDAARNARFLRLRSMFEEMDDILVVVDPPTVYRTAVLPQTQTWSGVFEFTVREKGDGS